MQVFQSAGFAWDKIAPHFVQRVKDLSGGRLEITPFPADALVPTMQLLESVGKGAVEMAYSGPVYWRGTYPAMDLFWGVPTAFQNAQELEYMWWDMGMIELARQEYAKANDFLLSPIFSSPYGGIMSTKPIKTLQDIKGLKMRSFGVTADIWKSLGASIVSVPAGEMYTALATKTIDAANWGACTSLPR